MLGLVLAAVAAATAPDHNLAEASHAIDAGRLDQARTMIAKAVAEGASGNPVDHLVADLAYAAGKYDEAFVRYSSLLVDIPDDQPALEHAGIAAFKIGRTADSARLLGRATASPSASWRAWNAQGAVADLSRDWAGADAAYARAAALAPESAEVANNQGWSRLLRGDWQGAIAPLERAALLDPKSQRIADNLQLARDAASDELPSRLPNESASEWAARLNDAGVIAEIRGDARRAVAAFTQAIQARESWYARAANNLKHVEAK